MQNVSLPFVGAAILAITCAFFIGRWTAPDTNSSISTSSTSDQNLQPIAVKEENKNIEVDIQVSPEATSKENSIVTPADPSPPEQETTAAVSEGNLSEQKEKTATPTETIVTRTITPQSPNPFNLPRINTGVSDRKISQILSDVAQNLEDKKLVYSSKLMQDCSGIFHQMKDSLQKRLPVLSKVQGNYQYPSSKNVRNTRQIADWYHQNGNLLIVEDPMVSRNSIRPGAVMFYGKSNKKFKNITIDMLTDRDNNYTSNGAIMHIAVVTAVTTDEDGNVIDYTIMHGRNPRNPASRTGSKAVQSKRTKGLPPFGNWSQQWVAIANIATPQS